MSSREKAARGEAETIAERVTSERFVQRQQLEDKLALRTTELEAARRAATETAAERDQILSEVSHELRTLLTALFFELDSAREDEPLGGTRLAEVRRLLADMRTALDERAFGRRDDAGTPVPTRLWARHVCDQHDAVEPARRNTRSSGTTRRPAPASS